MSILRTPVFTNNKAASSKSPLCFYLYRTRNVPVLVFLSVCACVCVCVCVLCVNCVFTACMSIHVCGVYLLCALRSLSISVYPCAKKWLQIELSHNYLHLRWAPISRWLNKLETDEIEMFVCVCVSLMRGLWESLNVNIIDQADQYSGAVTMETHHWSEHWRSEMPRALPLFFVFLTYLFCRW